MKNNKQIEVVYVNTKLVQINNVIYKFSYIFYMWQLQSVIILSTPYTKEELERLVREL